MATQEAPLPHGAWTSPITADLIATSGIRLGAIRTDGDAVFWVEGRPTEGGRMVIVRRASDGTIDDVIPAPFSARTRANEYGGGAFIACGGRVYFSNDDDGRVYVTRGQDTPQALTPTGAFHFADFAVDDTRNRLVCVREDSTLSEANPVNTVVAIALDGSQRVDVLCDGEDFYSDPRVSPDGHVLSWLAWNQPDMPWDSSILWVAAFNDAGTPSGPRRCAGGDGVSVFQPEWSPAGVLHFVDDRTGWWNIRRWTEEGGDTPVTDHMAEVGFPQWNFGMTVYALHPSGAIAYAVCDRGQWSLMHLTAHGEARPLSLPFTEFDASIRFAGDAVVAHLGSPTQSDSVVLITVGDERYATLQRTASVAVADEWFSRPEQIEFPTEGGVTAHAFYYPPHHPTMSAPDGERPPLIIHSHGGPTAAASTSLRMSYQYWTSRGFAIVDVNYGGSTGFGRAYRDRLNGAWGIVDVHDCINAAKFLVQRGDVDGSRLAIAGGSAGGFTTLAALTFHDDLAAGVSSYGVGDLAALAEHTHKFEARYLDLLVAPWPSGRAVYDARSPIHHTDLLSCPVLLLQGLEDRVVPPAQAEQMMAAMRAKGLPCAYIPFPGEQHGWRRAETIKQALEAELSFYSQVFGFAAADEIPSITIENLASVSS